MQLSKEQSSQTRWLILTTGFVTTFMVWLDLADPINLPKMFILTLFSAWMFGTIAVAIFYRRAKSLSLGQWVLIAFAFAIFLAALLTDVRYTAFFGASHRNNGVLSYLALATVAMASMMSFRSSDVGQIRSGVVVLGGIMSLYGLLQVLGHDFFAWTNAYGRVIGTLGNPDFMSAIIGVTAIATLWFVFSTKVTWLRIGAVALLLLEIFVVKKTGSMQGLLAFAFGFVVVTISVLWQKNMRVGLVASVAALVAAVPIVLALFNMGPLASHLFRSSLRSRMDYWHAAFSMFKAHPLIGVGIERFGENYGQYAPQNQFSIAQSSDNAHNVILHLLATGGLLVILPYLFLIGLIFWTAIRAVRIVENQARIDLLSLLAFWTALLLISLISIDNLGVAIWFWITGGALYAISREWLTPSPEIPVGKRKSAKNGQKRLSDNSSYVAPIASLVSSIIILVIILPAWKSSSLLLNLEGNKSQLTNTQFINRINQVAGIQPKNSQTFIALTDLSLRISDSELAIKMGRAAIKKDPVSIVGNYLTATAYELLKKYEQAVPLRSKLLSIDPWDTKNMLELVKDYVALKDLASARDIVAKLSKIQPNGADAQAAAALIKG